MNSFYFFSWVRKEKRNIGMNNDPVPWKTCRFRKNTDDDYYNDVFRKMWLRFSHILKVYLHPSPQRQTFLKMKLLFSFLLYFELIVQSTGKQQMFFFLAFYVYILLLFILLAFSWIIAPSAKEKKTHTQERQQRPGTFITFPDGENKASHKRKNKYTKDVTAICKPRI